MNFEQQDAFFKKKVDKYYEQNARCHVCHRSLYFHQCQWAHIIPATKGYLNKYGVDVIHHPLNGRITCPKCNQKVLMDPKTHPIEAAELVAKIQEELDDK